MRAAALLLLTLTLASAGCAKNEERTADATTRAVYNNDYDAVTSDFTPTLAKTVTRAELGALSDVMHAHGDYKGLTETGSEPDGALDFVANFTNGNMIVKMKLDADGKISGYRVIPSSSSPG